MSDPKIVAKAYLETWNAASGQRSAALSSAWRPDAVYTDPLMSGKGHEALQAMMDSAMAQFPGHRFALEGSRTGMGISSGSAGRCAMAPRHRWPGEPTWSGWTRAAGSPR